MTTEFDVQKYRNSGTGRERWAVIHTRSATWYFPSTYGHKSAERLARYLNQNAV